MYFHRYIKAIFFLIKRWLKCCNAKYKIILAEIRDKIVSSRKRSFMKQYRRWYISNATTLYTSIRWKSQKSLYFKCKTKIKKSQKKTQRKPIANVYPNKTLIQGISAQLSTWIFCRYPVQSREMVIRTLTQRDRSTFSTTSFLFEGSFFL